MPRSSTQPCMDGLTEPISQRTKLRRQKGEVLAKARVRNRDRAMRDLEAHPCLQQSRFSFSSEQLSWARPMRRPAKVPWGGERSWNLHPGAQGLAQPPGASRG